MSQNKPVVIVGFPGIGKSVLASRQSFIADLDFPKLPMDEYIERIKEAIEQDKVVLLPSWPTLRLALQSNNIPYGVVRPHGSLKPAYMERYKARGSTETLIATMDVCWDKFISSFDAEHCVCMTVLVDEQQYLDDVFDSVVAEIKERTQ